MLTPKEKAKELVHKYIALTDGWVYGKDNWEHKKKCALIAVDEIVEIFEFMVASNLEDHQLMAILNYWDEVKQEIEKL